MHRICVFRCTLFTAICLALSVDILHPRHGLAQDEPPRTARENGDVDGDGELDLTDAIYLLTYLYRGGPAPVSVVPPDLEQTIDDLTGIVADLEEQVAVAESALDALLPYSYIVVPLHAVRVSDDDGSRSAAITPEEVALWVHEANHIFTRARISLRFTPSYDGGDWSTIDNSLINGMTGEQQADWAERRAEGDSVAAQFPGKLVVFFRHGPDAAPTSGGFSWTDYDFVTLPGFTNTFVCGHQNITLLAHEVGHYLGLRHTFAFDQPNVAAAAQTLSEAGYDPEVFDGDGIAETLPDPFTRDIDCTYALSASIGGVTFALERLNLMSYYDSTQKTLSTEQVRIMRQAAILRTGGNIGDVVQPAASQVFEGEAIVGAATGDGSFAAQTNMTSFHGKWSGDAQLFWNGAGGTGSLSTTLTVTTAGLYRLFGSFTHAPDFGVHQMTVNEIATSEALDLYSKYVRPGGPRELGVFWLPAGESELSFEVLGKNTRSSGYALGLDYVLAVPLPTPQ